MIDPSRQLGRTAEEATGEHVAGARREALLEAATTLFGERGYEGTTVEAIAQRAGANKAMVSYYFGGKAGLYATIVRTTVGAAAARLEPLREDPRPAPERLAEAVAGLGEMMTRHPSLPAMLVREALSGGRHVERDLLGLFLSLFGTVAAIASDGVRDGHFRPLNPMFTHLSVVGSLIFFFATAPMRERLIAEGMFPLAAPLEPEGYVRHVQELMARGLAPPAGSGAAAPRGGRD